MRKVEQKKGVDEEETTLCPSLRHSTWAPGSGCDKSKTMYQATPRVLWVEAEGVDWKGEGERWKEIGTLEEGRKLMG